MGCFLRDVNFRNALVKVIVLPTRVWATGDKGGTNLLTTCLVVKPGAGSPEIVITDFPDEDLLQPRVGNINKLGNESFFGPKAQVAAVVCHYLGRRPR